MSADCTPNPAPFEPTNPPVLPAAPGSTQLITDLSTPPVRTTRQETDAIGAMRRGLKEYLEQQQKDVDGVLIRFEEVFDEWATSEDVGVRYPSAAVLLADGTVTYDASDFAPRVFDEDLLPDGRYVIKTSEATTEFLVEIHTSSKGERGAISMLMEEALNPVDFMYGFYLSLPHYFGQWAHFQLLAAEAPDDPATIRHGLRLLKMRLVGNISVVRPRGLPLASPKLEVDVQTDGQDFTVPIGASAVSQGDLG